MPANPIRSVSDTALWMAYYRFMESQRPDAVFHDPYARRLAGERGEEIVHSLRQGRAMSWAMVTRTAVIDELVLSAITRDGCGAVLDLAAGLDTRPYRLELPATTQWIEVDLPALLQYKEEQLAGEKPKCSLRRVALDLAQPEPRRKLFAEINGSGRPVVIITEGLLGYLDPEEVAALARDLHGQERFSLWITDIASPMVRQRTQKIWGKKLKAAGAPIKFAPEEREEFFRPHGWCAREFRDMLAESRRLNREMPMAWVGRLMQTLAPGRYAKMAEKWRSGMVLLGRC